MYLALRSISQDKAGWFENNSATRERVAGMLGVSASTFSRHYRRCKELGWVRVNPWNRGKFGIVSMRTLRLLLRVRGRRVVVVRDPDLRGNVAQFRGFASAVLVTSNIEVRQALLSLRERKRGGDTSVMSDSETNVTEVKTKNGDKQLKGHVSNQILADLMMVSRSTASLAKRRAAMAGHLRIQSRFHPTIRCHRRADPSILFPSDQIAARMLPRMRVIGSEWRLQMTDEITTLMTFRLRGRVHDKEVYSEILSKEGSVGILSRDLITAVKRRKMTLVESEDGSQYYAFDGDGNYYHGMSREVNSIEDFLLTNKGSYRRASEEDQLQILWLLQDAMSGSKVRLHQPKREEKDNPQIRGFLMNLGVSDVFGSVSSSEGSLNSSSHSMYNLT